MAESEVSRRDFLKRGSALGGAVLWATPAIQVVGMRPALAQVASPACNVWYAVKIDPSENPVHPHCLDIHNQTPNEPPGLGGERVGRCLDPQDIDAPEPVAGGCEGHIVSSTTPDDASWTIVLAQDCQFVPGSDRCWVMTGEQDGFCMSDVCTWDFATRTLTFPQPDQNDISHVEFAFCCAD